MDLSRTRLAFAVSFLVVCLGAGGDASCPEVKCRLHPNIANAELEEVTPSIGDTADTTYGDYLYDENSIPLYDLNVQLRVKCNHGYGLTKNRSEALVTCQRFSARQCDVGVWSEDVTAMCSPVITGCNSSSLRNATLTQTCHDVTALIDFVPINHTSCMRCVDGFQLIDATGHEASSLLITCLPTGQWNEAAKCTRTIVHIERKTGGTLDCSDFKCLHPNVTHGLAETPLPSDKGGSDETGEYDYYYYGDEEGIPQYPLNTRMTIRCNHGYLFNGTNLSTGVITCDRKSSARKCDVRWNENTTALCSPTTCKPKALRYARLTVTCDDINELTNPVPANSTGCLRCQSGFKMIDEVGRAISSLETTCLKTGQWAAPAKCVNVLACPQLADPLYGSTASFDNLTRAVFKCDPTFVMFGGGVLECEQGKWSGPPPKCRHKTSCLRALPLGNITFRAGRQGHGPWAWPNTHANYSCDPGYTHLTDTTSIRCVDGNWRPVPRCVPDKPFICPEFPAIPHGSRTLKPSRILPGTEAILTCDNGYAVQGSAKRVCQEEGSWSGGSASCKSMTRCPTPPVVDKAYPPKDGDYLEGDVIRYRCKAGYEVNGRSRITCTDQGWTPVQLSCRAVYCGRPSNIRNTVMEGKNFGFGDAVSYRCRDGYKMTAGILTTRLCQPNRKWTVISMKCEEALCSALPQIPHATLEQVSGWSRRYESVYRYLCQRGYKFAGADAGATDVKLTCRGDQTWNRSEPACEDARCLPLPDISHGFLELKRGTPLFPGSTYRYTCKRGYTFPGRESGVDFVDIKCGDDGAWSRHTPRCEIVTCPKLDAPVHGYVKGSTDIDDYTYGASYAVGCDYGYKLEGKEPGEETYRNCQFDGNWSGQQGNCQDRKIFHSHKEWADFFKNNKRNCCPPWREDGYEWKSSCPLNEGIKEECLYTGWSGLRWRDSTCWYRELEEYGDWYSNDRKQVYYALLGVKVEKFQNQCCWAKNGKDYQCYESYNGGR